ncbi:PHP domain-containing protein, partial [Candidatus Dependentiae bacterium]|nr:PHP domain-containing protein [Candidatus Dependentiae bacterium]
MYFHLHNHFFGSFSDSVLRIESAVKLAKENNHKALGITDHGTLAAVWPFYFSCIENNIIPVLGCELYFSFEDNKNNKISHLVVLAKNLEGFFNLVRIVSDAWTDNFLPPKYAVVKLNKLIERKAGLIVLSGCIGGPIGISLSSGNIEQAELIFKKFYSEFGKDFYPEVSGHDIAMQSKVNSFISGMCKKYNCNPVLTNDCHYPDFESSFIHDIYIKTADKYASNFSYSSNCFYYKNNFEMNKMNFPETYYSVCSEILDKISLHKELPEYIAGIKSKKEKKGESHPVTIAEPFYISPEMAIESVCRTIKVSEPKIAEMIKIYKNYGSIEEVYYQNLTFKNYCEYYSISLKTIQGLCGLTKAYLPEHRYFIELDDSLKNIIPLRRVYGELIADIEKLTLNKLGIPINQKINISESSCNFFKGVKLWWYGEYETALSYLKSNERLNRDVLFLIGDCLYNTEKTNESIPYFKNFLESDMPSYHSSFSTQSETRISLLSSHNERHEFLPEIFSNLKTNDDYKKLFGILQIFIPSYLLIILLKKPNNYKFDFRKVHYTFLFSDISGFTKLLNELQNSGDQAAEILTTTINSIFTNFISIINEYGGSILKFGGDSLMAMYPENITNKSMAKINAAFTALKIIDFLKNKQPIEIFKKKYVFNIHIGISSGEVISTVLNYKNIRKEYYICGKTLSKLAEAEKMAESGEIVISRKSAIELPPQFNLIQVKGSKDFFYINNNSNYVYPQEFKNSMERISDFEIDRNKCRELCFKLFQFIPSAVLSSIINLNYKYDLLSVNRNIAVVFINISGFSDMISLNEKHFCDNLKSSVKRYFEKLIDITTAYKGEFLRSDISHSGEKFLIIFGAPVCYDNFTENTLRFAIEMRDAIKKINSEIRTKCKKNICKCRISQQTGINYGNAFIGLIGSLNRKEYTVMGNVVNIAARLMSIAPKDKIYCGSDIAEKHSELFKFKKKYAYLKGIKEKYDFFELIGKKDSQNILRKDYTIFLGRKNETEIVEKILYNENFFPYFIHIIGQAGTGKSSFVRHIQKIFINNGFKIFSAGYSLHLSSVPFYMWKQLLKKLITEKIGHDLKKSLLAIQKQYLLKCIPLIANLLDIKIQDNSDEYSNHDSKNNKSEFFQSIIELFFILAEDRVLIILEDIHWIDEISLELLQELIKHNKNQKNIKKLYFIMTQRPENIFINDCDNRIYTKIDIKPFTFSEMKQYIKNLNINSNISNKYAFEIYQKTSGNPFFISQIINSSQNVLENSKIPDSVNSVIISQFDKFFENEKLILSFAAIAGREFKFEVIEYISKKMRLKINLFSAMKKFCDNNFLHFIGNNKEKNTYLFNHDL